MAIKIQQLLVRTKPPAKEQRLMARSSPSKEDVDFDRDLEFELLTMLSEAEQALDRLKSAKVRSQPRLALKVLEEQINRMAVVAESLPIVSSADSLAASLEAAGEICPQAALVHVNENRASLDTVINLHHGWTGGTADREAAFREICHGLTIAVESFVEIFAVCFSSPQRADVWKETYEVYIRELASALEAVDF